MTKSRSKSESPPPAGATCEDWFRKLSPVSTAKKRMIREKMLPSGLNSNPPNIFWVTPKPKKIPTASMMPKSMIILPICSGIWDSITSMYRNQTRIPATAIMILTRNSPMRRDVKKPTTPAAGIIKPIPDFMSLAILKLH